MFRSVAIIGLFMAALQVMLVKDPENLVSAHPLAMISQICIAQAILYFFMFTTNVAETCRLMKMSFLEPMLKWIPIKNRMLYWHNEEFDPDTITFRFMWHISNDMIGFLGLVSILLNGFFLIDMILTWRQPLKYISTQKHVVPLYLLASKIGQVVLFLALAKDLEAVLKLEISVVLLELFVTIAIFFGICVRWCQGHV